MGVAHNEAVVFVHLSTGYDEWGYPLAAGESLSQQYCA